MSSTNTIVQPTIFREYIHDLDFPYHIINPKIKEFHFILPLTEEFDKITNRGTGKFLPRWNSDFNAEKINILKHKYNVQVKVIICIGDRGRFPFNPQENTIWLSKAKQSLKDIIDHFNNGCNLIDDIDVNYESIECSEDVFAICIGELIKYLKEVVAIEVASIAPSESVQGHYKKLYKIYGHIIDWVDYQFYNQIKSIPTSEHFVLLYKKLSKDYPNKKLLAGFSTDPRDKGKIERQVFLEGCRHLLANKLLPGIFVWDAEHSKKEGYAFEIDAQALLVKFSLTTQE